MSRSLDLCVHICVMCSKGIQTEAILKKYPDEKSNTYPDPKVSKPKLYLKTKYPDQRAIREIFIFNRIVILAFNNLTSAKRKHFCNLSIDIILIIPVSTIEKDIDTRLTKAWKAIDRLSIIWKSHLTDKMKRSFFQASVVSILLHEGTSWTLTKRLE